MFFFSNYPFQRSNSEKFRAKRERERKREGYRDGTPKYYPGDESAKRLEGKVSWSKKLHLADKNNEARAFSGS